MSFFGYEISDVRHRHDRYGVHSLRAQTYNAPALILQPHVGAIDPQHRIMFPSIRCNDLVHCQGGGDFFQGILYKEPSQTDTVMCGCGTAYQANATTVWCSNPACHKTELARSRYFIASLYQNKLTAQALNMIIDELNASGFKTLLDLLTYDPRQDWSRTLSGPVAQLMTGLWKLRIDIRDRRNVFDVEQNSFILSFLDSLGIPDLTLTDIYLLSSHESLDHQNGEGGDSSEYYHNALSNPEFLESVTNMPAARALSIAHSVSNRRLSDVFQSFSRGPIYDTDFPIYDDGL